MSTASDILRELMARVRREMFHGKPDKTWYAQQTLVKKALTYPAHWLHERHIPFTARRYREIVDGIITTMVQKGDLARIQFLSRYILHCVQEHMRHHDDTYYNEGKGLALDTALTIAQRNLARRAAQGPDPELAALAKTHELLSLGARRAAQGPDPELAALAKTHELLSLGARKPKAKKPVEPDLFATTSRPPLRSPSK